MNFHYSSHNISLTDSLKDHLEDRLIKLQKHFDRIVDIHVDVKIEKKNHIAEATIHINGGTLFAKADSHDMYETFNNLTRKLDQQILKHKEKLTDHHGKEMDHHLPYKLKLPQSK